MDLTKTGKPLLSIVVPVYNESDHLCLVLKTIEENAKTIGEAFEIILIDDGSNDATWEILKVEAQHIANLRAIRLSRNFGKESAICAGLEMATGQGIILMDGDLQHPPELIPQMVSIWRSENVQVVEAVKKKRSKESVHIRMGSHIFYRFLRILTGYDLMGASDFKLLDRKVLDALLAMRERNVFFRGMSTWVGFNKAQVEFDVQLRVGGKSGWSIRDLVRLAITGITSFSSLPLQMISFAGIVFFGFAVILGIQTLYMKISGRALSGFTTIILLQLIIGSILMWGLGMIGVYISKIFYEVKARPRYIIEESLIVGHKMNDHC